MEEIVGLEDFEIHELVGEGTYGTVHKAILKKTGERVALKKVSMKHLQIEGFPITAIREIRYLATLNHPNVVRLIGMVAPAQTDLVDSRGDFYMIFEWCDHDLNGVMEWRRRSLKPSPLFNLPEVKLLMKQLLEGLAFCHFHGVVHRDVKSANLLINSKGEMKIGDFGLARLVLHSHDISSPTFTNRVVTLWYRPPELILGAVAYGPEVDMWSAGCIMGELLAGSPIFAGDEELNVLSRIFSICGAPTRKSIPNLEKLEHWEKYESDLDSFIFWKKRTVQDYFRKYAQADPNATDLIDKLLILDPAERITAKKALDHPFFREGVPPCPPDELRIANHNCHEMGYKLKRRAERAARG